MNEQTIDITEAAANESETRKKMKKGVTVVFIAAGVILLIDDQIKRFSRRKRVAVTVADQPAS